MEERKAIKRGSATSIIRKDSFTMHQRRKPPREKHKRRTLKNKLTYGIIAVAVILVCFFAFSSLHPENPSSDGQTSPPKAALVDHLSLNPETKNETFRENCRIILEGAEFYMTYYESSHVTVDFYRNLPTLGYSLVIFRVHSAIIGDTENVGLFTSEPYNPSLYVEEQNDGQLVKAFFTDGSPEYFGITPNFVKHSMNGDFKNTIIILMGCDGLKYNTMAEAFVEKDARVCIGWSGLVDISHTDQATTRLLQHLITENQTVAEAVRTTMREVGHDPWWGSELLYYGV